MRIAIVYPPLESEKGVALLTQNRQFQWFSRPTYIFPVVPATAATMLKKAGHEVLFLDAIAAGLDDAETDARLAAFRPDYVVIETKTPVVKRHWEWIAARDYKVVMVGDHVTAMPEETMEKSPVDFILTGGDWDFLLRNLVSSSFDPAKFEAGIWYRAEGENSRPSPFGAYANTGRFRLDHDQKTTPWIDRDLCHWKLYAVKNGNFRRTPGTYIMSGRDCWHAKCTFCS
ncbi:MAG: cobalamin-dependent protein, partial [Kiritimatiellae bacterium]|nr:cobalamin-dependent protein [Kiritimatiellia bacterium]